MVNRRKADVVLLYYGWVERVKVKEQDEAVVESTLWFQNQTTRVGGFSSTTPTTSVFFTFCNGIMLCVCGGEGRVEGINSETLKVSK